MKYIIVDDEEAARNQMALLLKDIPGLHKIGEASNGIEAIRVIETIHPDLVFLDVQMPGLNGFEVINQINLEKLPEVVFVTAYDQYAIKAFEIDALDYLLKPVDPARLEITIEKIRKKTDIEKTTGEETIRKISKQNNTPLSRIPVREGHLMKLLNFNEILWMEFENRVIYVQTKSRKYETNFDSLKELEPRLDPDEFFRINRTQLINLNNIKEIIPGYGNQLSIQMDQKEARVLSVSREQSRKLKQLLSL